MSAPKLNKTLEQLGISRARAASLHRAAVAAGRFKMDISGRSVPTYLAEDERISDPTGDDERVWFVARLTSKQAGFHDEQRGTGDMAYGYRRQIVAVSKGAYPGTLVETVLGETDEDCMFTEVKP